jgi:nucleoside-diphosphate-sugar epimerase
MKTAVLRITGVWSPEATAGYAAKDHGGAAADCAMYWWSYVDARDVARAFRLALEAPNLPPYGAYFISAADTMIDEPTADAMSRHWPGVPIPSGLTGHQSVLSVAAAQRAFGFIPKYSWRK